MRPVAVFDLDGTLVRRDTFLPFLFHYGRRHWRLRASLTAPWWLAAYAGRLIPDFAAKERLLTSFLAGECLADIAAHAEWFCERWVARRLHPLAMARLDEHRRSGHRTILLSASPSVYVEAVARFLGIEEAVSTRVRSENGRCLGTLDGGNCKGAAKLCRLQEYLGVEETPDDSHAYGDSTHDLPVLRWVQHGFLVRRRSIVAVERSPLAPVPAP